MANPDRLSPSSIPADLIGHRFAGYRLVRLIGRGGMSEVYEAVQESLNRRVAVKVLPPQLAKDEAFIKRFERESGALAQLSHPNIVAIYERGHEGEYYYFVLEYVEGKDGGPAPTLYARMKRGEPLSLPEIIPIMQQILDALEYAHSKGVVHRDIKPANIMLDSRGNARLVDFGIAHIIHPEARGAGRVTTHGEVLGTAGYVAPEQREGRTETDARADIFSCGALCYEMLMGRLPEGVFEKPSELAHGLDPRWDAVIEKALHRNPERRYQTMSEFADAIRTITAPPIPLPTPAPQPIVRAVFPRAFETSGSPSTVVRVTPIVGQCPKCKTLNPGANRFCTECGMSLVELCPACKAENRVGTKYCGKCGSELAKLRRIERWRIRVRELANMAATAPLKQAVAILNEARDILGQWLTDAPDDKEAAEQKSQIEARYRAVRTEEAQKLASQADQETPGDAVVSMTKAWDVVCSLKKDFPTDASVTELEKNIRQRLREKHYRHARAANKPSEAMRRFREMLAAIPADADAQKELERLEQQLAVVKTGVKFLMEAGRYREALEHLEEGLQQFEDDPELLRLRDTAREARAKLLKLAQEEIPKLWNQRRYVAMTKHLIELATLRANVDGMAEARLEAMNATDQAKQTTRRADQFFSTGNYAEALALYQRALSHCADYQEALDGAKAAQEAIHRLARRKQRWIAGVTGLIIVIVTALAFLFINRLRDAGEWKALQQQIAKAGADDFRIVQLYDNFLARLPESRHAATAQERREPLAQRLFAAMIEAGQQAQANNNWLAAVEAFQRAVKLNPSDAQAWSSLGAVSKQLGRTADAIIAFEQAAKLNPADANAWASLSATYQEAGHSADALAAAQKLVALKPDAASSWYRLGVGYQSVRRFDDAVAAFKQAIEYDTHFADAWLRLGQTYSATAKWGDAIPALERAVELNRDNAQAWNELGVAYTNIRRIIDAIHSLQQAVKHNPTLADAWANLSVAFFKNNQLEKAMWARDELSKLDPERAKRLEWR